MNGKVSIYDIENGGKTNIFGWVMFLSSIALIIFTIYDIYNRSKQQKQDKLQDDKIRELEQNLKRLMGNNYQPLNPNS